MASVRIGGTRCHYHCVPARNGVLASSQTELLSVYPLCSEVRNLGCVLGSRKCTRKCVSLVSVGDCRVVECCYGQLCVSKYVPMVH